MRGQNQVRICPKCHQEITTEDSSFCSTCGTELSSIDPDQDSIGADEDLSIEVTEANPEEREFVGGQSEFKTSDGESPQAAPIRSSDEDAPNQGFRELDLGPIDQPIGSSAGFDDQEPEPDKPKQVETGSGDSSPDSDDSYASDREKERIIGQLTSQSKPSQSTSAPNETDRVKIPNPELSTQQQITKEEGNTSKAVELPTPVISSRGRGVALFYKNYIQLASHGELHSGDELTIKDRYYVLKPKKFNPKVLALVTAAAFALVLFFVGVMIVGGPSTGDGEIIGVVLDDLGQPYLLNARVKFPDLGKTTQSNSMGFFRAELVPSGTHRIEYYIDNELVATDFATVTADKVSMVLLQPDPIGEEPSSTQADESPQNTQNIDAARRAETTPVTTEKRPATKSSSKSKRSSKTSVKANNAALSLEANVDGARLQLSGKILGAGNMTYRNLKPGVHNYALSADGYQTREGKVTLKSGKTKTLQITLEPLETAEKTKTFDQDDYYYSGVTALNAGDYETGLADLTRAIELDPGNADAYIKRAETYQALRLPSQAHDDFLRAAEILRMDKKYNTAITCFGKALESDKKSVPAHLGRADLYIALGEEIAAIADYQATLKLDKKNPRAHFGLGEARFRQGANYKKAIKHFKEARKLDPTNPLTHQYLMLSYLAVDDTKNLKKSYEKFIKNASANDVARFRSDAKYSAVLRVAEGG